VSPGARAACLVILSILLWGCPAKQPSSSVTERLQVFVGVLPQKYLVDRVGGDRVSVGTLVQPGQDPHTFEPTPRQISSLAGSKLYFQIGLSFEGTLIDRMRSSMPELRIVDTRAGITLMPLDAADEQGDAGMDPHIWMDPRLAKRQALTIRDALIAADPRGRSSYEAGYEALARDLDSVHAELAAALASLRGKEILVFHPAFGYFAQAYGLKQVAVESGGKEPSARELARLIDRCRASGARVVFVQPQFSQAGARAVAEAIGGVVQPMDDLSYDYIANLRNMAKSVTAALGGGGARQ
jgi:zinc transport system substrate-binding protein